MAKMNSEIKHLLVMKQHMVRFRRILDQASADPKMLHAADHPLVTKEESQLALRQVYVMLRKDLDRRMAELDNWHRRVEEELRDAKE